jgi:hypothetical protein
MTETNVPAQASDEPMRAVRSIGTDPAFEAAAKRLHLAWTVEGVHALINAADAFVAAQVTPRATADVERDAARWQWMRQNWFMFGGAVHSLNSVLGMNLHRINIAGDTHTLDVAVDAAIADDIDATIAATKGAKP